MVDGNSKYVKGDKNSANESMLQLTMREMQALFANPRVWIGLFAIIAILTVSGPFGTDKSLNHAERFVFWGIEASLTFFCGTAIATMIHLFTKQFFGDTWITKLIGAFLVGFPISLIVFGTNILFFGTRVATWDAYVSLLGSILAISFAATILFYLIARPPVDPSATTQPEAAQSPFINRLPVELGRNLLHISSQDHYVEAVTDRGTHMVLMRFSDALEELTPLVGVRVHRSHWVAHAAISGTSRKNGRMMVETVNGRQFPVSRSYQKGVREALNL